MPLIYRKGTESQLGYIGQVSGAVVPIKKGVLFRCPCGDLDFYVAPSTHTITFDEQNKLTLDGSVGSHKHPDHDPPLPQNWCHFHIKDGAAVMTADAQCPGNKLGGGRYLANRL